MIGDQVTASERAKYARNRFPGGTNEFADLFMRERKAKARFVICGLSSYAPVEQQAGKSRRRRMREPYCAQLFADHGVIAAHFLSHGTIGFGMTIKKLEKVAATNEGNLRWIKRLSCHLAQSARKNRREPQHNSVTTDATSSHVGTLFGCSSDESPKETVPRRPARVNNEGKACLDQVALNLQHSSDAKLSIVGNASSKAKGGRKLAAQRVANTKAYLVGEKGIDASRIVPFTGSEDAEKVTIILIPSGATLDSTGNTPVN